MSRALAAYRALYVAFIVTASAATLAGALTASQTVGHVHALLFVTVLASAEIAAALALLWRRTETIACAGLLAVYAVAGVASAMEGDIPLRFAYYAATACFIVFLSRMAARA